jgi:hypothetical protein
MELPSKQVGFQCAGVKEKLIESRSREFDTVRYFSFDDICI